MSDLLRPAMEGVGFFTDQNGARWLDPPSPSALPDAPPTPARQPKRDRGEFVIGEIEDDVPLPPRRGKADDIPFGELQVGQSVAVQGISGAGLLSASKRFVDNHPECAEWQFCTRDVGETSARIWRKR